MSSTSTTYINSINTNYPVPGVDNDTQGFRDNYTNIKSALSTLAGEVGGLQLNGVVTDDTSDFSYEGILYRPVIDSYGVKLTNVTPSSPLSTDETLDAASGNYQQVSVSGTLNLDVTNWADNDSDNVMSQVLLEIYNGSGTTATVNFSNTLGTLKKDVSLPISVASSGTVFVELWTPNAGTTVFLRKIGGSFV